MNIHRLRILKYRIQSFFSRYYKAEFEYLKGKRKCIICLAADYGNLGDVAITYAQAKFLREKFPEYEVVDFPISKTITHLKSLKRICSKDDIITLTGGGYMGDLYFRSELFRELLIKTFRKNRIISFPQTADFSSSISGIQLLKIAKDIYSDCPRLELWTRDKKSYSFVQREFPNNIVRLTPDIVMWLNEIDVTNNKREGFVFCLRNDKEKSEDIDKKRSYIRDILQEFDEKIENCDTHIGDVKLSIDERFSELTKIWTTFRKAKLVVTDRLHGMIFAYITGTPAIVLPNSNFKIEACYQWIKECQYIKFMRNNTILANDIKQLMETDTKQEFYKTHSKIVQVFDSVIK